MTIQAVIWDMGGVIVRTEDWTHRQRWESRTRRSALELTKLVFEGDMGNQAQLGTADEEQVWDWVYRQLDLSPVEGQEFRQDFFAGDVVDQALVGYIRDLQKTRKTGLLSNAFREIRNWLEEEWRIADAFDQILISAELGVAKPDLRIYTLALDRLQVSPAEAIFIDDSLANVQAAQGLGIHSIRFHSPESTIRKVEALLRTSTA